LILDKYETTVKSELYSLYERRGYVRYKPVCFEEYSLYQENKDFLIGKNVITFSDLDGKLLAMRPDVTLSIVKHCDVDKNSTAKFFYNEKVYRQSAGAKRYKEINQTGVEIIGCVDELSIAEIALLICETLSAVSSDYVVDISHMGFTEGLLSAFGAEYHDILDEYLKKKNLHDFYTLANRCGFPQKLVKGFEVAVNCGGEYKTALKEAKVLAQTADMSNALNELYRLCTRLDSFGFGDKININFAVSNNADYYNGVIFNGYIGGIPHCVLSGGRYDLLLKKLNKVGGAVGFALYFGEIERYFKKRDGKVDFLIKYDDCCEDSALKLAEEKLKAGFSAKISRTEVGEKYGELLDLTKGKI